MGTPPVFTVFNDLTYAQNSRVVSLPGTAGCWLIDPGLSPAAEEMLKYIEDNSLEPNAVILTHAHADHIAGLPTVLDAFASLPVYLAKAEWPFLTDPAQNLSIFFGAQIRVDAADVRDLPEGQALELEDTRWQVLDTAGHSPGGRTFYCPEHAVAIVGDALFAGSVGRTDFPHSDGALMFRNIREKLLTLPGETRVLSGHGPDTDIDTERSTNPFLS